MDKQDAKWKYPKGKKANLVENNKQFEKRLEYVTRWYTLGISNHV